MFHLIFSVENDISVVIEKVRICGNEEDVFHSNRVALWAGDVYDYVILFLFCLYILFYTCNQYHAY